MLAVMPIAASAVSAAKVSGSMVANRSATA